jgi:hypothetical protein
MKLKEMAALAAASTSSKVVDDASKEVVNSKPRSASKICGRRSAWTSLKPSATAEPFKKRWTGSRLKPEKTMSIKTNLLSSEKNADEKTKAKHAHQQKVADGKLMVLERSKQPKINVVTSRCQSFKAKRA